MQGFNSWEAIAVNHKVHNSNSKDDTWNLILLDIKIREINQNWFSNLSGNLATLLKFQPASIFFAAFLKPDIMDGVMKH